MKYIVVETHLSHTIVLSENGVFIKTANLNYEVGQTVEHIFEMKEPETRFFESNRFVGLLSLVSAIAVIVVAIFINRPLTTHYFASVILKINPEVRININQEKDVMSLEGVNPDGVLLIEGYDFKNKKLDPVMDELVDRAIEKGFLYDGGQVNITFDGNDKTWLVDATSNMKQHVKDSIHNKVSATFVIGDTLTNNFELVIPVDFDDSDYDDNDYDDNDSNDNDSNPPHQVPIDDSEYDDSDYEEVDYGDSEYDDTDYDD